MAHKVKEEDLQDLFKATVVLLNDVLSNGVIDEEGVKKPAPPAYVNAAIALIKHNNISAIVDATTPLEAINKLALPFTSASNEIDNEIMH